MCALKVAAQGDRLQRALSCSKKGERSVLNSVRENPLHQCAHEAILRFEGGVVGQIEAVGGFVR